MRGLRWTPEQLKLLAGQTGLILEEHPGLNLGTALYNAQLLLPVETQLAESSLRSYDKHSKGLRKALEAEGVVYPVTRKSARKASVIVAGVVPPPTVASPPLALSEASQLQLITQLLQVQQREIAKQVEEAISLRIAQAFESHPDQVEATPVGIPKTEQPRSFQRFLIVGLLPAQVMVTSTKLKHLCDLRYWTDNGTDKLRAACGWADFVVTMTKFISHSTEVVIKGTGARLLRCNGGVTDLVAQVQHQLKE